MSGTMQAALLLAGTVLIAVLAAILLAFWICRSRGQPRAKQKAAITAAKGCKKVG